MPLLCLVGSGDDVEGGGQLASGVHIVDLSMTSLVEHGILPKVIVCHGTVS